MKLNKRRKICLVLIALFACALTFAGLKGWSHWKKKTDFQLHILKMGSLCDQLYMLSCFWEEDKPIIDNYVAYNKRDKPLGSWRMAFLYYAYKIDSSGTPWPDPNDNKWIEGGDLFGKYYHPFKSWNEEPNYSYHYKYLCWNDDPRSPSYNDASVMTVVGEGTAFEKVQTIKDDNDYASIVLGECGSAILLIEAVNSGIHWGEPGDFNIETITKEQLFPDNTEGILVAFGDQKIWYVKRTVPMETLMHFMTVESSKEHDREKELSPYGRDANEFLPHEFERMLKLWERLYNAPMR